MALGYAKLGSNAVVGTSGTTVVITTSATAEVGNLIVVVVGAGSDVTETVADSAGNTYQQDATITGTNGLAIFSALVTSELASGGTITATYSGSTAERMAGAYEVTGAAASSWLDDSATSSNGGTPTSHPSGSIDTTVADSIIFSGIYFQDNEPDKTYTKDAAHTQADKLTTDNRTMLVQYRIISATGTHNPTATSSAGINSKGATVNYEMAAAAGATGHQNMMMLGVG